MNALTNRLLLRSSKMYALNHDWRTSLLRPLLLLLTVGLLGTGCAEDPPPVDPEHRTAEAGEEAAVGGDVKNFQSEGLLGQYFHNVSQGFGDLIMERVDSTINFNWGTGSPSPGVVPTDYFAIRWTGYITLPEGGAWQFRMRTDDGVRLWLGDTAGAPLIDDWFPRGPANSDVTVNMPAGTYPIRIEYFENTGGAVAQFSWRAPSSGSFSIVPASALRTGPPTNGLLGTYHHLITTGGARAFGASILQRVDPQIAFNWGTGSPHPSVPADDFAIRWEGFIEFPESGQWTLRMRTDDGVRMWLDGEQIMNDWVDRGPTNSDATRTLTRGLYPVVIEYYERGGGATAEFFWQRQGGPSMQLVPSAFLFPELPDSGAMGLTGTYYSGIDFIAEAATRQDDAIDFDWTSDSVPAEVEGAAFSARWEGQIRSPSSQPFVLRLVSSEGARVWIDDQLVIDRWAAREQGHADVTLAIPSFTNSSIRVEAFDRSGAGQTRLQWSVNGDPFGRVPASMLIPDLPPEDDSGLLGTYFNDDQFIRPAFNRIDPSVDFNWGQGSPDARVGVNNFSIRWEGQLIPTATGMTTFHLTSDDGARLFINDTLVIDDLASDGLSTSTGNVELEAGVPVSIRVDYRERYMTARAQLEWTPAGGTRAIVPPSAFRRPALPVGDGSGLRGEFFDGLNFETSAGQRTDAAIDLSFGPDVPFDGMTPEGWSARWQGELRPRFTERTEFCIVGAGGYRLGVDGSTIIDRWEAGPHDMSCGTVNLVRNRRTPIRVDKLEQSETSTLRLIWRSAYQPWEIIPESQLILPSDTLGGGEGLRGEYFDDGDFSLTRMTRIDATLDFDWTESFPDPSLSPPNLSVRWNGQVEALHTEPHDLIFRADGGVRVVLDGNVLLNQPEHVGPGEWRVTVPLVRGLRYELVVEYNHGSGAPAASMSWESESIGTEQVVPRSQLFPPFIEGNIDTTFCEYWTEAILEDGEFDGVDIDTEGGVRLAGRQNVATGSVFVANSGSSSVTRIDAFSGEMIAHYPVQNYPSRTAIDFDGNVWVANRNSHTVTKIQGDDCEGAACVLFTTPSLPDHGSSAPRGLAIDGDGYPWVGAGSGGWLYQLNPINGDITAAFRTGWYHYGFAIDRENKIWVARMNDNRLGCFDTRTGEECGSFPVPTTSAGSCDNANPRQYGIAIDGEGNIWTAGWDCGVLMRFNREAYDTLGVGTFDYFDFPDTPVQNRGVAVDGEGYIWSVSSSASRLYRFNPETESFDVNVTTCSTPVGVGVIDDGSLWVNCFGSNNARRHRGSTHANPGAAMMTTATQTNPYSYSDYTGFQLRNFTAPQGTWRNTFDCTALGGGGTGDGFSAEGVCTVDTIDWSASVPGGTNMRLRVRTSDDGINWSPWSNQFQTAPVRFEGDVPPGRYIEVEAILTTETDDQTPNLTEIKFWTCPDMQAPSAPEPEDRVIISGTPPVNYGITWAFTDNSRLETDFEILNENGFIFCSVSSDTGYGTGQRYSGDAPSPGCAETFFPPNHPLTRSARAIRRTPAGTLRSPPSPEVTAYTLTNVPHDPDLRIVGVDYHSLTVQWRRPANQSTHEAGQTGVWLERSADPAFDSSHPTFTRIAHPSDPGRGYPPGGDVIGTLDDTGLDRGTVYHYRIRFQNADGIPSPWYTISAETFGAPCCYLGLCVGVCANAETGPNGPNGLPGCEQPPAYEPVEISCDGLDNSCNGIVDEVTRPCYSGSDETRNVGECRDGSEICLGGEWQGNCTGEVLPQPEECNGRDDDCNGIIDDGIGVPWFRDSDGDGFGDPDNSILACGQPDGYVGNDLDCDDTDASINPDAMELCDGQDNNCNGEIDEGYGVGERCVGGRDSCSGIAPPGLPVGACFGGCRIGTFVCASDALSSICSALPVEGLDVTIDEITTGRDVDLSACVNGLDANPCDGTIGVLITVRNTTGGTVPRDSRIMLYLDNAPNDPLLDVSVFDADIMPGGEVTLQVCYPNLVEVLSAAGRTLHAEVVPAGGDRSCTHVDDTGTVEDVYLPICGPEQCDGFDNNGNGEVDEHPEACGAVDLECIYLEITDEYVCVGLLEEDAPRCPEVACPSGTLCTEGRCIQECRSSDECGEGTKCHYGLCVLPGASASRFDGDDRDAARAPADAASPDATAADALGGQAAPRAGCAVSDNRGGVPGEAIALFLLGGLILRRRLRPPH